MSWHVEGEDVPEDEPETFESIMAAEYPEGPPAVPVAQSEVGMTAEVRNTYWQVEALCYAVNALHMEPAVLAKCVEEFPELIDLLTGMPTIQWMASTFGRDHVAALDKLSDWHVRGLPASLAHAIGDYMTEHTMAEHIHMWVPLTGIGFIMVSVSQNYEDPLRLGLPDAPEVED